MAKGGVKTPAEEPRVTGTVTKLMPEKGFGFIADSNGVEYFFHRTSVRSGWETLVLTQPVTFLARTGPKGPRAEDVEIP